MTTLSPENASALEAEMEALLDRYGMGNVLGALATVASGKAEHIASAWQDAKLAKRWERFAARLDRASYDVTGIL